MLALRQWGEKWESGVPSTPVLVDLRDQQPIRKVEILSHDGRVLNVHDLCWVHAEDVKPLEAVKLKAVA